MRNEKSRSARACLYHRLRTFCSGIFGQLLLVVVLFGAAFWADRARVVVYASRSPQARALFPPPMVQGNATEGYHLWYPVQNLEARDLYRQISSDSFNLEKRSYPDNYHQILFLVSQSKTDLERLLRRLQELDVEMPGEAVVRGLATDARGRPLRHQNFEVVGAVGINIDSYTGATRGSTRYDGTFTIVLRRPSTTFRWTCSLRFVGVGYPAEVVQTNSFVVDNDRRFVTIKVSRTVFEEHDVLYWLAALVLAAVVVGHAARFVVQRRLRTPGTCPKCRYDLRGTSGDVCSECGWPLSEKLKAESAAQPLD